jgi:hypothetical protein
MNYEAISVKYYEFVYLRSGARMGKRRGAYMVSEGKPEGSNHLKDPSVDGRTIIK